MSSLDNLRKEAKRWLKALRAGDADARARLIRAWPSGPPVPALRDLQHALAREHGFESWAAFSRVLADGASADPNAGLPPTGGTTHAERVATFLQFACWDHHVHGVSDHRMYAHAARRLLEQHPEIARDSLYTAVVCGDVEEVERILAERPEAAREPGGARGWEPILYLCFTRFPYPPAIKHAVAIGRALLDRGANPNAFYMAGDASYTALVGVAGEGEQASPRQPKAAELFQLLLERGAEPFDIQVLYNTHFSCDMIWWLDLVYAHTLKSGRKEAWDDPDWTMLDMGGYGPGAYFILNAAIEKGAPELARWALEHGANPNVPESSHSKFKPKRVLYDGAILRGQTGIAELLARHGATRGGLAFNDDEAFVAACFRMDRDAVRRSIEKHPEYLKSTTAIFTAAERDRTDIVAFLLDLGVPLEIEDNRKQRILHMASSDSTLRVAKLLIDRGAAVDPRETAYGATPLGYAVHYWQEKAIAFLSQFSRDVWNLAFTGNVDRLRMLLKTEPDLAAAVAPDGHTPLWWLPENEKRALEIVELLLQHGADPTVRVNGRTAASWALKCGMPEVARRLAVDGETITDIQSSDPARARSLDEFDRLAQDLVFAFETGQPAAMQHLQQHLGAPFTWDALRAGVREQLGKLSESERPAGYFALPHARLLIARHANFDSWDALIRSLTGDVESVVPAVSHAASPPVHDTTARFIQPVELRAELRVRLHDGVQTTPAEVWSMLSAALDGDLERMRALVGACPSLVRCDHNYMPPLHLAVREGHLDVVGFLASHGAVNPNHVTYPYNEKLVIVALDRGFFEIARLLEEHVRSGDTGRSDDESGEIQYGLSPDLHRLQNLVSANALAAVEAILETRPELAQSPLAFSAEGILSIPANRRNRSMIELLLRYGARVPDVCKWGRAYYLKHRDIAALLLEHGMNANQMNHHHTTLLHDMAWEGDAGKAVLLLDHGADIDAVDEEFRSTPLGLAARWGRHELVVLLLERGANPNLSGAPWATPLAWARKKAHERVEAMLTAAGALR